MTVVFTSWKDASNENKAGIPEGMAWREKEQRRHVRMTCGCPDCPAYQGIIFKY
jgi:hypothetical protein